MAGLMHMRLTKSKPVTAEVGDAMAFCGFVGYGLGALVAVGAGIASSGLIVAPLFVGSMGGMFAGGVPLWCGVTARVTRVLIEQPDARIYFYQPQNEHDTYALFLQRLRPVLNPGDIAIDTKSLEDNIKITYTVEKGEKLEWMIPICSVAAKQAIQAEQSTRFNGKKLRKALIISPDMTLVQHHYNRKCFRRTVTCSIVGAIVAGIFACALLGFPPTFAFGAIGLVALAGFILSGATMGAKIGLSTYKTHQKSKTSQAGVFAPQACNRRQAIKPFKLRSTDGIYPL